MELTSRQTVVIVGAGPFGVSVAAHLRSAGVDFRIFGKPMYRWRYQMPKGMFLKSEGCASNLSDPLGRCTLARYCAAAGLDYRERGKPVPLDVFTEYALDFQREFASDVEEVMVTGLESSSDGFHVQLANGTTVKAGKVIVATGLEYTAQIPPVLRLLPKKLCSHSADHHDLSEFAGRDVLVVGGGQSALEAVALLSEQGVSSRLLVRKSSLAWNTPPSTNVRSHYQRIRHPMSNLGEGLELWMYCTAPMLFRYLPSSIRSEKVRTVLGPAGAWWLRDRVDGQVQILTGHSISKAEPVQGRIRVQATGSDGETTELVTDHVIAATGYRFDVNALPFLSPALKSRLRLDQEAPVLSRDFESSVPGLYFTGLASANSFGPGMRFLQGAAYTARAISSHIAGRMRVVRQIARFSARNSRDVQGFVERF
jgi:cation diffusion facilitator CzcD-associated flavoprotein CzcO